MNEEASAYIIKIRYDSNRKSFRNIYFHRLSSRLITGLMTSGPSGRILGGGAPAPASINEIRVAQ